MGLPRETASFRVTEGDYGMPFFIAYPKSELLQFLPDKGLLEPFGHESFPEQADDIPRSATFGKKILHPLAETATRTHQVVAPQTEILHTFQIELLTGQQGAEKRPIGVILPEFRRQHADRYACPAIGSVIKPDVFPYIQPRGVCHAIRGFRHDGKRLPSGVPFPFQQGYCRFTGLLV
ncbi:hypothetical protein ABG862_16930 [Bacteroides xylanisolvens]|uniref:hypothetical protein n=1 Tax=Bacteroides TaxID=816 RepID=UPI0013793ACE|nr:hypothetical protein [Bacteroides thetaiotaomicron]MCE8734627.1 hypothetical protein [Bacteroides thetaiotaomicron]